MEQSLIPSIVTALVGAVVSIVTAVVSSRTQIAVAQISAQGNKPTSPPGEDQQIPADKPQTTATPIVPRKGSAGGLLKAAVVCGVLLSAFGIYSTIQASTSNARTRQTGIVLNDVTVHSDWTSDDDTRLYRLWIEADEDVLDSIDHVKYVFDDVEWSAKSVLRSTDRGSEKRRGFERELNSTDALSYITVLIMYDNYKSTGKIQPVRFRWSDEAIEAE